ncbi:MAG: UbiD family decarboxylase [Dehalococcoidia bacterium]|nr:UbiD family decarboxylase [Dehalococcoidia bacterium]
MAFRDLREYIARLEAEGELRRIQAEVDWNLELGAISRRAIELRAPAPLFENIKGYSPSYRVLANPLSGTRPSFGRLALAMGLPKNTSTLDLIDIFAKRIKNHIKPIIVSTGPCKEEILLGDDVNVLKFPVPLIHGKDGGRYIGTWHVDINKDPDTGWVNWGMYRHMVHDEKSIGWLATPYQHGPNIFYQKYEARGEPMPMAIAIGTEPLCSVAATTGFPAQTSEADVAGGLREAPVELVKCETIDLEVPATAEIVLEGMVYPGERRLEGSFGEFTGYDAGGKLPRPVFRVQCITHRQNPILTMSNPGKGWEEDDVVLTINGSATIKNDLESLGLPFKSVYVVPPTLAVVVSAKNQYNGYAHTLASAIWTSKGAIYKPYVFVVGEDVDVTDPEDVLWCLTTRLHPKRGIYVLENTPISPLTPFLSKQDKQNGMGARVLFDATFPYNWAEEDRPTVIDLEHGWPRDVREKVLSRWEEYGLDGP